ncbi:hypothetical protein GCM10009738_20780 [Kitasatospora viridis]
MAIDQVGQTAGHLITRAVDPPHRRSDTPRDPLGPRFPMPRSGAPATAPGQQPDFRFVKDECVDSE